MNQAIDALDLVLGRACATAKLRSAATVSNSPRSAGDDGRLRDVVRFLQLLVDDAQSPDGGRTSLGFDTARVELDACDRQAACEALVALLQDALGRAGTADCWLASGTPALEARTAWRVLDDLRDEQPWLPGPEAAQQGAAQLADALLEALGRSTNEPAQAVLWRARWLHASGCLDEAEVLYRRLAAPVPATASGREGGAGGATESRPTRSPAAGAKDAARDGDDGATASHCTRLQAARDMCALLLQRGAVREAALWRASWRTSTEHLSVATPTSTCAASSGATSIPSSSGANAPRSAAPMSMTPVWTGPASAGPASAGPASIAPNSMGARSAAADVAGASAHGWSLLDGALALAEGDWAVARVHLAAVDLASVPLALVELSRALPECAEALPGAATGMRAGAGTPRPRLERRSVGAAALVAYAQGVDGAVRPVHADAAVGLRSFLADHATVREDALAVSGSLEARLFAGGRGVVEHAQPVGRAALVGDRHLERVAPIVGAIGRGAKCVALEPILDETGEPIGWLHLEWEHHLVPPECVRRNLASRALEHLRRAPAGTRTKESGEFGAIASSTGACAPAEDAPPREHLRAEFERCVEALELKWTRRVWRAFLVEDGVPIEVHRGGALDAFGLQAVPGDSQEQRSASGGKALSRALAWRTCAGFDAPDPRAALWPEAKSGVVLPLDLGGRVVGAIAIESQHARDFRDFDGHALQHRLAGRAMALRLAAFRDDHRRRHGWAPAFDARRGDLLAFATRLSEVARSRCVLAISGEHGSGKLVVARWTHFEGGSSRGPFVVQPAGAGALDWTRLLRAAHGGTLVVDQLESMVEAEQRRFLQVLDGHQLEDERPVRAQGARIVACCIDGLARLAADGRLRPDLAARLARYELVVPPLRRRRADIPVLFGAMLARFADEEGCRAPEVAEEALAVLFRQEHPGNLRDLEAMAQRLVVHERGGIVAAADIERIAREHGWKLAPRIPSRHPRVEDIRDALWSTRMQSGRTNKTRAALWLGWDPDTLVARMADLGIADQVDPQAAWPAEPSSAMEGGSPADPEE